MMGINLDIDDACAIHPLARVELKNIRRQAALRAKRMIAMRDFIQQHLGGWQAFMQYEPGAKDWFDADGFLSDDYETPSRRKDD